MSKSLSSTAKRALVEYLRIASTHLRELADRDAFHTYQSEAAEQRFRDHADEADRLRTQLTTQVEDV